jgi:glycosyltransferase involved in cell wall biosynthesis
MSSAAAQTRAGASPASTQLVEQEVETAISAAICTRNRPDDLLRAVRSVLDSDDGVDIELIVVDQSDDDSTRDALRQFDGDGRLRYVRSSGRGVGLSRNEAAAAARGPIIAYTDDDCEVPPRWLRDVRDAFADPRVGIVFSSVIAAPFDYTAGTTPATGYARTQVFRSNLAYSRTSGMGAGLSIRRGCLDAVSGFDRMLGPGSPLYSGEDLDIGIRALLRGWSVMEAPSIGVVHHGFRDLDAYRHLLARDWAAAGAVQAKFVKAGRLSILPRVAYDLVYRIGWQGLSPLLRGKKPTGVRKAAAFGRGFWKGLRTPVDPASLHFIRTEGTR